MTNEFINEFTIAEWWRKVCTVTPWLAISGDLPANYDDAIKKLDEWRAAGITDIIDVRGEYSDESFVKSLAPAIRYWYFGTHDNGGAQDYAWFERGIMAARTARQQEGAKLMVHCHMGINRGPSMAFAILLDAGYEVVEALDMIRDARPISGIIYASDAIRAVGEMKDWTDEQIDADITEAYNWFDFNDIDLNSIIHAIRVEELPSGVQYINATGELVIKN